MIYRVVPQARWSVLQQSAQSGKLPSSEEEEKDRTMSRYLSLWKTQKSPRWNHLSWGDAGTPTNPKHFLCDKGFTKRRGNVRLNKCRVSAMTSVYTAPPWSPGKIYSCFTFPKARNTNNYILHCSEQCPSDPQTHLQAAGNTGLKHRCTLVSEGSICKQQLKFVTLFSTLTQSPSLKTTVWWGSTCRCSWSGP